MMFLLSILLGTFLGARPSAPTPPPRKVAAEASRSPQSDASRLRLAWFNALDRSFTVDMGAGPLDATLHAPDGTLLTVIHQGPMGPHEVLRITEDLPAGVYLLRLRQGTRRAVERVTLL